MVFCCRDAQWRYSSPPSNIFIPACLDDGLVHRILYNPHTESTEMVGIYQVPSGSIHKQVLDPWKIPQDLSSQMCQRGSQRNLNRVKFTCCIWCLIPYPLTYIFITKEYIYHLDTSLYINTLPYTGVGRSFHLEMHTLSSTYFGMILPYPIYENGI